MTISAAGGINLGGFGMVLGADILAGGGEVFLRIGTSFSMTVDGFREAGWRLVFCRLAGRSSTNSFSFSLRASKGDCICTDFPIGPLGVPRRVFNDLCRNCGVGRERLLDATGVGF